MLIMIIGGTKWRGGCGHNNATQPRHSYLNNPPKEWPIQNVGWQLKNAFGRQKQAITGLRISPIDTTLPIKKGGVLFRLGFFSRRFFRPRAYPPPNPPSLYRKINNAALFSARKPCTDTDGARVCAASTQRSDGLPLFFPSALKFAHDVVPGTLRAFD